MARAYQRRMFACPEPTCTTRMPFAYVCPKHRKALVPVIEGATRKDIETKGGR